MRALLYLSALSFSLAAAGCAANSSGNPGPSVRIENRSSADVDVYVRPNLARPVRLGFVPASDTVEFALSPAIVAGSPGFYLEARPVRGGGRPIQSEPFNAKGSEEIFWSIPPQ